MATKIYLLHVYTKGEKHNGRGVFADGSKQEMLQLMADILAYRDFYHLEKGDTLIITDYKTGKIIREVTA